MGIQKTIAGALVAAAMTFAPFAVHAENKPVDITFGGKSTAQVMHKGKLVTIQRVQDNKNNVDASFAKTSRPCPPFCIQPISLAPGVETIGENEMIDYLEKMTAGDDSVLVVDSRTPNWVERGQIPGAVNVPWTKLNTAKLITKDFFPFLFPLILS